MLVKLLNKIGLYTARQMQELSFYAEAVEARVNKYVLKCKKLEDDFENRICRNCKYLIKTKKGLLCSNPVNYDYIITDENFGCNRFERKENERD